MRCPNCGMDIVIATHLCPHCGYEHDFDGAIEKRRDIPEPWELTPGRAWKRRQRRERAASVWAENRAGREKVPEREFAVRESSARRSGSGGALMHVLCLVSFGIMALLLFGSALLLYTGIYYDAIGAGSAEYIYYQLPELPLRARRRRKASQKRPCGRAQLLCRCRALRRSQPRLRLPHYGGIRRDGPVRRNAQRAHRLRDICRHSGAALPAEPPALRRLRELFPLPPV